MLLEAAVGWTADELATHVREEFSTYSWILEAMLQRTGFEVVERGFRRSAYGAYTCRRRRRGKSRRGGAMMSAKACDGDEPRDCAPPILREGGSDADSD